MVTISISDKMIKKGTEFVVIPRKDYEKLLAVKKIPKQTKKQRYINELLKDVREGNLRGPFNSVEELRADLEK